MLLFHIPLKQWNLWTHLRSTWGHVWAEGCEDHVLWEAQTANTVCALQHSVLWAREGSGCCILLGCEWSSWKSSLMTINPPAELAWLVFFFFSWKRGFSGSWFALPECMTSLQSIEIILHHHGAGSCYRVLLFPQVHFKDGSVIADKCDETNRLRRFAAAECFSTRGYFGPPGNSGQW